MTLAAAARAMAVTAVLLAGRAEGGCPFQNPFWFVDRPRVEAVTAVAEGFLPRVRLMWGRIENFKCVDYFYVEYFQRRDPAGTVRRSARISRDRRSLEIEVRSHIPLLCINDNSKFAGHAMCGLLHQSHRVGGLERSAGGLQDGL